MAFRTWAKLFWATLGAGALAGASQLGLAYGLGVLRLTRTIDVTVRDQWVAQLAWVTWIAMTSAVAGAMAGRLLLPRHAGAGTRIVAALAAALGSAVVVPLTMQPARTAQVDGVRPVFIIGVCAGLGAAIGILAAYGALSHPVARWNATAVGAAVWVIAIGSVSPSMAPSGPLPAVRLGVVDAAFLHHSMTQRTALFTMPVLALLCGLAVGVAARRRAMPTLQVALAGLSGPALLTVAYLVAGPGAGTQRYQVVPYWAAMTAAGAGVLGSVLIAVLSRGPAVPAGGAEQPEQSAEQPTPERPPLPRRKRQASAIARAAAAAAERPEEQLRPSDTGVFTVPPGSPIFGTPPGSPAFGSPAFGTPPGSPTSNNAPSDTPAAHRAPDGPTFNGFTPRPQPEPMNAPPAAPAPVSPPLPATPAPRPRGRGRQGDRGRGQQGDEFVDWVSGLGNR